MCIEENGLCACVLLWAKLKNTRITKGDAAPQRTCDTIHAPPRIKEQQNEKITPYAPQKVKEADTQPRVPTLPRPNCG